MKDQLAIYPNRFTLFGGFLASVTFAGIAIVMLILFKDDMPLFVTIVFWAILLLFGFLAITSGISFTRNFFNPKPQLLLGPAGITFCDTNRTPYQLDWQLILCFQQITIARQEFILIGVTNPAALIEAEPNAKYRRLMKHNLNHYGTPFTIAPTLSLAIEKLLPILREFHEKYRPHESA